MIQCSKCGKDLGEGEERGPLASISAEIMGDEDTESWYFCPDCQVYTVEKYHDRFVGEDSVSIQGPIEKARGDAQVAIIRRCPNPWNKRCTCPAHREYFGNWVG